MECAYTTAVDSSGAIHDGLPHAIRRQVVWRALNAEVVALSTPAASTTALPTTSATSAT